MRSAEGLSEGLNYITREVLRRKDYEVDHEPPLYSLLFSILKEFLKQE